LGNNRPHYDYLSAAGRVIEDGIVIESRASSPLRLKVYAADGYTTPDGLLDLRPAAEPPTDAGAWISFGTPAAGDLDMAGGVGSGDGGGPGLGPADAAWPGLAFVEVTLEPSSSVTVPFRWTIPADAPPGDHAAGIVTSLVEDRAEASVQVDRRLALRAYINIDGDLNPALTVSDLRVEAASSSNPFTSGRLRIAYTLANTGSARLVPTERIAVAGPFGWGGREAGAGQVLPEILPGSHLTREVTVAGVFPLFRTKTEVMVDAVAIGLGAEGATASGVSATTIWTVPWVWLAVLAALLVAAVVIPRALARRQGAGDG
jgi:hypothetical protein